MEGVRALLERARTERRGEEANEGNKGERERSTHLVLTILALYLTLNSCANPSCMAITAAFVLAYVTNAVLDIKLDALAILTTCP